MFLGRLLEEDVAKRAELEEIHIHQQRAISETEAEKQQLEKARLAKESALEAAMLQLEQLESERQGALEQYQVRYFTTIMYAYCLSFRLEFLVSQYSNSDV